MKPARLLFALFLFSHTHVTAAPPPAPEPFTIYAPSRETNQIWEVHAIPGDEGLTLEAGENIPLDFSPATITAHPRKKMIYVTSTRPDKNVSGGVTVDFTS